MEYRTIREIGRGGFGVVSEVEGEDGYRYASKTLAVPAHLDATQMMSRFEREVRYQSAIDHLNVVEILEHHLEAEPPWFVMPLAECTLHDEMLADRHLGGDPRTALFDILAGLEEIHRLGYCHRDLKPHNVLRFSGEDGNPIYALSDFGLMAVGEDTSSALTPSGIGGGTPAYQAPECAINFKRATARSDIYSFGALLHDIFAANPKRLPHEELSAPGQVGQVIEKCTKRNAHRRYKNVEQLREALFEALIDGEFSFESSAEKKIVGILANDTTLPTPEEWDEIFDFLDTTSDDGIPTRNVFRALRRDHIEQLSSDDPDLMAALGKMFATHCRRHAFDFDYCDVLATKAQLFYDLGDTGLKADIAVAMLELGVNHNRWFVERRFVRMVNPEVSDALAQRVVVEMSVLKIDFAGRFSVLSRAIGISSNRLHPALEAIVQQ